MPYTTPENITGFINWMQYANSVSDNLFTPLILIGLYAVVFIYMAMNPNNDTVDVAMYAGFFVMLLTIILRVAEVVTTNFYVFIAVLSFAIPVIISVNLNRN